MLAVVIANVGNHRGNGIEYAQRMRSDFMKHIAVQHKVYCVTDQPACFYPRTRCKPHPVGVKWDESRLFRQEQFTEDRILYFSLDTIIIEDIDELAAYDGPFAMSAKGHIMAWPNGASYYDTAQPLEKVFPGMIAPYSNQPPEGARIITFDNAPHKAGGWVAEYWEHAHG
jgi:hypothetical protein